MPAQSLHKPLWDIEEGAYMAGLSEALIYGGGGVNTSRVNLAPAQPVIIARPDAPKMQPPIRQTAPEHRLRMPS